VPDTFHVARRIRGEPAGYVLCAACDSDWDRGQHVLASGWSVRGQVDGPGTVMTVVAPGGDAAEVSALGAVPRDERRVAVTAANVQRDRAVQDD